MIGRNLGDPFQATFQEGPRHYIRITGCPVPAGTWYRRPGMVRPCAPTIDGRIRDVSVMARERGEPYLADAP